MPSPSDTGAAGTSSTRVFVVDDHEMVAHSLGVAIGNEPGFEVVGTATSMRACLEDAPRLEPDVVVMDLRLGDGDGLMATRRLRSSYPEVNVIMLTAVADDGALARALEAGCCGFVTKQARIEDLFVAIRAAANGTTSFPLGMVDQLVRRGDHATRPDLSARELEVLRLLAAGQSTTTIAETLSLSVHTTRNHVRNIMTKLDAHSRLDAVVLAARSGLIDLP
jgi:DNA-binding NarL/FixJ family response regulator